MDSYVEHSKKYIEDDYRRPKHSTQAFTNFLRDNECFRLDDNDIVIDMGTGGGSGLYQLARAFPEASFLGLDYNAELVSWINKSFFKQHAEFCLGNMAVDYGDWTKPEDIIASCKKNIKGVMSVHALCTLKHFSDAASYLIALKPDWIAFNSLFYDGPLDVLIHIRDRNLDMSDDNPDADFNIHSLPYAIEYMRTKGYRAKAVKPFEIATPLAKPSGGKRGTFTVRTEWSQYSQFSGPVYLPWHFVLFEKDIATQS